MKNLRARTGPFKERPYYSAQEVERICEDALRGTDLYPQTPQPIRIDRFIEKHFKVTPTYEDLGSGVLGLTQFGPKGVQAVIIAKTLDVEETAAAERRIRSTLAHEAGHGLLHSHLFALGMHTKPLFGDLSDPDAPKVLCREESVPSGGGPGAYRNWWEYQANLAIGALLLPRQLMEAAIEPLLGQSGMLQTRTLAPNSRESAARLVSETFDVNPIVARIRLQEMYPQSDQLHL